MTISKKTSNLIAFTLLGLMLITSFLSAKRDSLTFDELAHIPAGYSYLSKQDYRLNPEHPPLTKDIAAFPLLFLKLNFPQDSQAWLQEDSAPAWWVQFDAGREFIYRSNNNPREIILWSRLGMIFLTLLLGWVLFSWVRKITNNFVALGVLSLFALSPNFLAHGHLVTSDIGATLGSLLAIIFWLKFLEKPSWKNIFLAGFAFGLALLLKFSLILLIPFFVLLTLIYVFLFSKPLLPYLGKSILVGLIGFIFVIWPVYQLHVLNYPQEQQLRDTIADISQHPIPLAKDITLWLTEQNSFRGLAQFLRGLLMASQRTAWGNTTCFLGKISAESWWYYFPLIYLFKVPLPFHLLTLFVLFLFFYLRRNPDLSLKKLIKENFWLIAAILWILIYWIVAIVGNLNIGIRHILPTFPFIYLLIVFFLDQILKMVKDKRPILIVSYLALFFFAFSSFQAFPHYLSYYNELAGGKEDGYKIAVDSNYDWGQDFYELLDFIEKEKIEKIWVDYFGGEDPEYWLGEKFVFLNPRELESIPQGWLAVSLNQYLGGTNNPTTCFDQEAGYYDWLKDYPPVARAGYSILIFKID